MSKGFLFFAALLCACLAPLPVLWAETPESPVPFDSAVLFEPPSRSQRQVRSSIPARFIRQARGGGISEETTDPLSIPGLDNPLTQRYIQQYSKTGGLAWLKAVMDRGEPYLAFIHREVRERNLPPELVYLPVIESGFLSTAVSRSGAAGLWQFMRNSISGYGMGISDYADERMDFWKSTQGALKKLEDNYKQLGDWPLALAAYNAGLGGVNRLIQQTGVRDYWILADRRLLKTETIHYIPKLLAVSHILSNPRQYGFSPPWPEDPQWTRISLDQSVDLELLAEYAGVNRDILKKGNSELRYTITPPVKGYQLKVRQADVPAILAALEREDLSLIRYHFHTIAYGDTLSALAQHYRLSVDQILAANPGAEARYLQIGGKLRIPAITDAGPYERRSSAGNGNTSPIFEGTHLVKRGETLWSIALAYEVDPQILADVNGMGLNDTLREGRILKTPIIR